MKKLMLGLMMAFAVAAEAEIVKEYTLTDSLTATLDDQGVLMIIGSGAMPDWSSDSDQVWFNECSQIKSVVVEAVTSVGQHSFDGCENLVSVSLPSATKIGSFAFFWCEKLTSVSLPSATTIGERAFYNCKSLESVSLPNATTIEAKAFQNCSLDTIFLPNALTIGVNAFAYCDLTSVLLPNATTIGNMAFFLCEKLTLVSLPNATTIESDAFLSCTGLSSLVVNAEMQKTLDGDRTSYGIPETATITVFHPLSEEVVKAAGYEYETQVSVSTVVKSGGTVIDENDYLVSCTILGIPPQKKLNETDFKVVSKDAQVIGSDEIAVKKESIQAAKAETISIANNEIQLGVSVMSNSNITAEIAKWGKVNLASENVKVENGNVVITIPVDSASGFMILQSGDAKVQSDQLKLSGGKVFTGDY